MGAKNQRIKKFHQPIDFMIEQSIIQTMSSCVITRKVGSPKQCRYCGATFTPERSTGEFCKKSHNVAFFKRKRRQAERERKRAARSGMFLDFDGRTSGQLRSGFGYTDPAKQPKRDPAVPPVDKGKRKTEEDAEHSPVLTRDTPVFPPARGVQSLSRKSGAGMGNQSGPRAVL